MSFKENTVSDSRTKSIDPFIFLFSITLLLSASLTFTIQPMIGKMLLPLVGGAPSGWLVTMVYFQLALLAGYTIAHLLSRISAVKHVIVIITFLLIGMIAFPIHLPSNLIESSGMPEAFGVLLALFLSLTVPCVALFTLSPSLQRLFDASSTRTKRDPYFLFAASNVGSLGGLLAYPLVIERYSGLSMQAHLWQMAYFILITLCVICLFFSWKQTQRVQATETITSAQKISWKTRTRWVFLAFIPSSLMLGVTAHITTDTGSVPFFWVLPLALYLLTFIFAFAQKQFLSLVKIGFLQTASIGFLMVYFIKSPSIVSAPEEMAFPVLAFFLTALFCHCTLAFERPHTKNLTEFYLWVAVGGALGGSFNTFVAPFIFPLPIEFMLVSLLSCTIHPERQILRKRGAQRLVLFAGGISIILAVVCTTGLFDALESRIPSLLAIAALTLSMSVLSLSPRLLIGLSLVFSGFAISTHYAHMLYVNRDFFGVTRIFQMSHEQEGTSERLLYHGSTLHGKEQIAPKVNVTPNGYYDVDGPLGDMMKLFQPSDIGIVGMGVGTTLCYQAPDRHYTVYELDPAIPGIAEKWFDYARTCGIPEIHIGDGRRMLATGGNVRYDLLTLDAFTSDTIPLHLLTKEAFQIYFDHLKPNGVLAVHISNRFYDLRQPISNITFDMKLAALYKTYFPLPSRPLAAPSRWVAVTRNATELEPLRQQGWENLPPSTGPAWTDDFSDALSTLKILQPKTEAFHAKTH